MIRLGIAFIQNQRSIKVELYNSWSPQTNIKKYVINIYIYIIITKHIHFITFKISKNVINSQLTQIFFLTIFQKQSSKIHYNKFYNVCRNTETYINL
jgi:hypothetical protein